MIRKITNNVVVPSLIKRGRLSIVLLHLQCLGQRLSIFVQPVNDKQPVVTVRPLQVFENGYVIIMPTNLDATDEDTSDQSITFTVERLPRHGKLKLQGSLS